MERLKSNSNKLANLERKTVCSLLMTTVTYLADRISVGAVCHSGDLVRSLDDPGSCARATRAPSSHLCGRDDCPVFTDAAGTMWCWCRTVDIRDLCD